MLWVAHESFDDKDRKRAKYTFAISERIYLLNASFNNGGFLVSELNPRNYELKRIDVELHNFVAPHSVYGGSLVVHAGRAYLWHARSEKLYVGWIVNANAVAFQLRLWDMASVDSRKAAELDGKSVKAYYFWGRAALQLGQLIDEDLERSRGRLLDESEVENAKMEAHEGDRLLRGKTPRGPCYYALCNNLRPCGHEGTPSTGQPLRLSNKSPPQRRSKDDISHWAVEETRGAVPSGRYGNAYCKWGNSLLIHGGFEDLPASVSADTYELDLDTKIWTRRDTVASQEILTAFASTNRWDGCGVTAGWRMHVIGSKGEAHFVLDLSTNRWSAVRAEGAARLPIVFNSFCACDHIFFYGMPSPEEGSVLYRLDEERNEWVQVFAAGARSPRLSTTYQNTLVAGTRVFFIEGQEVERMDGEESSASMSVLELNPNLFDQAASVLLRSERGKEAIRNVLPRYLSNQLVPDKTERRSDEEEDEKKEEDGRYPMGILREIRMLRARHGLTE
ncbi:hypothetical protein PRIPAC_71273 [Pristionchus pacificus]|uniref:Uncharacterized protein n=1 Tax=Pristionchus pacificus TaxID=54126 RepID=A0A2A6C809_PRIPA|nr:hypothetical protein PRIPAC_71273 [Pristionchus pacificus]|eukprot:PDM74240.1 hypothetical protein PRIPAC_41596 [Pristionchus pacificus]